MIPCSLHRRARPAGALLATTALLSASAASLPRRAYAFCVMKAENRWQPPPGPIPVYASGGLLDGLDRVGIGGPGASDEHRWLQAAIAIVNEASTDAPRLYFAGVNYQAEVGVNFWSSRLDGITVSTYPSCGQPTGGFATFTHSGQKGAIRLRLGAGGGCGTGIWWVDPAEEATPGVDWNLDYVGVLVHELEHALGLDHTNVMDPLNSCDTTFPYLATRNAVMNTGDKYFRRRLRRDDVEGLRELWGEPERIPRWSSSAATNPGPTTWLAPAGFSANLRVNTPVTLTTASRDNDGTITMAMTDGNDVVRYLNGTWGGWYGGTGAAVRTPGGDVIVSYDRVVAARGRKLDWSASGTYGARRLLVAWHGTDETTCCGPERVTNLNEPNGEPDVVHTRVWWKVHDGSAWHTPRYTSPTRYKELGAGYDPLADMFVLVGVDTCRPDGGGGCQSVADAPRDQMLFVRTIRGSDGSWACTQALSTAEHVLAVGDVSCDFRGFTIPASPTRCVIPVTTTESTGGPRLRFIEGEVTDYLGYTCFVRTVDPPTTLDLVATGTPSSALDGYHTPAQGTWLLGSHAPQFDVPSGAYASYGSAGWAQIFTVARDGSTGYVAPPPGNARTFDTDTWPIATGSLTRTFTPYVQWRAVGYAP